MNRLRLPRVIIVFFLLLVIPLTVILALQVQKVWKQAAFGQVTVNLVPAAITKGVNEEFSVDVYLNSGDLPVSAISLKALNLPLNIAYVRAAPEYGEGKPFTEVIVGTGENSLPITLLARKPTASLPKGSFKIATFFFKGTAAGAGSLSGANATIEVAGFNQTNDDVAFTVGAGAATAYTITSQPLCRIASCTNEITLTNTLRTDGKYNINVSWTTPSNVTNPYYKVFRNTDAIVPNTHPDANIVTTTNQTSFVDTNTDAGFTGSSTIYYDVDTYIACQ